MSLLDLEKQARNAIAGFGESCASEDEREASQLAHSPLSRYALESRWRNSHKRNSKTSQNGDGLAVSGKDKTPNSEMAITSISIEKPAAVEYSLRKDDEKWTDETGHPSSRDKTKMHREIVTPGRKIFAQEPCFLEMMLTDSQQMKKHSFSILEALTV